MSAEDRDELRRQALRELLETGRVLQRAYRAGLIGLDPRTVAAWELEDRIARGDPLGPDVTVAYSPLPAAVHVAIELRAVRLPYDCMLYVQHYSVAGVPLHPRRPASRVMEVRLRDLVIWREAVCRDCGLADFVVVERATLRSLGREVRANGHHN